MKRYTMRASRSKYPRLLETYCDYDPAHHRVRWTGYVNEMPYGQACTRHLGALIIDVHKRAKRVDGWYKVIRSLYNRYTLEAYPRHTVCYHRNRR